jgi:hypothetical protein
LRSLHERVHGPQADYAEALTREVVLELILRVLAQPAYRPVAWQQQGPVDAEAERTCALEMLRALKEYGCLEDYKDPIDLRPTLKLTRAGKAFAEVFADLDNSRSKTRQRNMRSAKKSLLAFLEGRDEDELLDAYDYATRVVQDMQEDIEYFRSLMQSLTREALTQKVAWGEFNDFLERRFAQEMSVRLVADSVDRHRTQIVDLLEQVRAFPAEVRTVLDAALCQRASWLAPELQGRSASLWLCQRMEQMVDAACDVKLPMLRSEMHNYVRRFTSLLRQALSLDYGAESAMGRSLARLKEGDEASKAELLDLLCQRLATAEVRLPQAGVRWSQRERQLTEGDEPTWQLRPDSRVEAAMRRAEAEAFIISEARLLASLDARAAGAPLRLSALAPDNAEGVLTALHLVGAVRASTGRAGAQPRYQATRLPNRFDTAYFSADDYELRPLAPAEAPPPPARPKNR